MSGPINDMINLWAIDEYWSSVAEICLTWRYIKMLKHKININFFLQDLDEKNDIFWIKNNFWLSKYKKEYNFYKTYNLEVLKNKLNNQYKQ